MIATWVDGLYYIAGADVPSSDGPCGYWLKRINYGDDGAQAPEQRYVDLDVFFGALLDISPTWHVYAGRWICFTDRDVALYRVTKDCLWSGKHTVMDYTGTLVPAPETGPEQMEFEL